MPRKKFRELSLRDLLAIGIPSLAALIAGFWIAAQFVKPAPPDRLVLSSGAQGGAYQLYAARYRQILERQGIELRERPSAGSLENLKRLNDGHEEVDVAFIQGGTAAGAEAPHLVTLGAVYYEPLWVFYTGAKELDRLTQLRGKRIATGPEGSGTRKLALDLLEANGVDGASARLLPLGGLAAVEALQTGEADAVFVVGAAQSGAVWSLLYSPGVRLMSFNLAEAYSRRFPYLSELVLPQGGIDLMRNIPPRDVRLIAPVATLVAREDTHPALIDLLLQAAAEVHGEAGLFQKAGEFPKPIKVDFPLSQEAERFYRSGKPFLQRYLPFWAATLVDRLIVMLVPIVAVLIPLLRFAPYLYSWRVRRRIYRWYGELKFLENEIATDPSAQTPREWLSRLERIERGAENIPTPLAFADQLYTLRAHIGLVREIIMRKTRGFLDGRSMSRGACRSFPDEDAPQQASEQVNEHTERQT
jgi:TRAP transporter TAXI family solute receptor